MTGIRTVGSDPIPRKDSKPGIETLRDLLRLEPGVAFPHVGLLSGRCHAPMPVVFPSAVAPVRFRYHDRRLAPWLLCIAGSQDGQIPGGCRQGASSSSGYRSAGHSSGFRVAFEGEGARLHGLLRQASTHGLGRKILPHSNRRRAFGKRPSPTVGTAAAGSDHLRTAPFFDAPTGRAPASGSRR
jgi:hypothetical protein